MATETKTLSYKLDNFLKYKDRRMEMPPSLIPYCYNSRKFNEPNILQYVEQMKLIVETISKGIDTNDVVFKNDIKYFVNTVNKKNFNDVIKKISKLNLKKKENLQFFVHELIVCTMRCPIAVKGIHKDKIGKLKAISEIIGDVIKYFCGTLTKENNDKLSFHDEFLKMCRKFFMDFVNITKSMDQNNENTSDNYRGFMSLLGLLFENNLLPHKIIFECIDSIKRNIFCSKDINKSHQITSKLTEQHEKMFGYDKIFDNDLYDTIVYYDSDVEQKNNVCFRNITECTNYYKGYENFCGHYVNFFNCKVEFFNNSLQHEETAKKIVCNENDKDFERTVAYYFRELNLESESKEEDILVIIKKINDNIENTRTNISKYIGYVEQFLNIHNEFETLNNIFKINNKDTYCSPLKQHIMINHNETTDELHKIIQNLKNL